MRFFFEKKEHKKRRFRTGSHRPPNGTPNIIGIYIEYRSTNQLYLTYTKMLRTITFLALQKPITVKPVTANTTDKIFTSINYL